MFDKFINIIFKCSCVIFLLCASALVLMALLGAYMGSFVSTVVIPTLIISLVFMYIFRPKPVRSVLNSAGKVLKTTDKHIANYFDEVNESLEKSLQKKILSQEKRRIRQEKVSLKRNREFIDADFIEK